MDKDIFVQNLIQVYSASQKKLLVTENAPECISGYANFKNFLRDTSQTPLPGGGFPLPHPPPCGFTTKKLQLL